MELLKTMRDDCSLLFIVNIQLLKEIDTKKELWETRNVSADQAEYVYFRETLDTVTELHEKVFEIAEPGWLLVKGSIIYMEEGVRKLTCSREIGPEDCEITETEFITRYKTDIGSKRKLFTAYMNYRNRGYCRYDRVDRWNLATMFNKVTLPKGALHI